MLNLQQVSAVIILLVFGNGSSGTPIERIVNGTDALEGEFPFVVSLQTNRGVHLCGSSIIHEHWILTAAHCVLERVPRGLTVKYGVTDISENGSNIVNVSNIYMHENYNRKTYANDIALLKLDRSMNFGKNVKPIDLARDHVADYTVATLIGWGRKENDGAMQKRLQKVNLFVINSERCSQIHFNPILEYNLCAGVMEGGKGQCTGDSGGPLIVEGHQHGIVSWSVKPCALAPYPGVLTKVAFYVNWIEKITGLKF